MLEFRDRTVHEPVVTTAPTGTGPPKAMPDIERYLRPRWPRRAKLAVAALSVLALAGVGGTVAQYVTDDDGSTATDTARIATLTAERDAMVAVNDDLTADLVITRDELTAVRTDLSETSVRLATASIERDAVEAELAAAEARITEQTGKVIELRLANENVTAERDALAALFPLTVDTSLVGADITGTYDATYRQAYNAGLADIVLPAVDEMTISTTPEGWLRVEIPGIGTAGLMRGDGMLVSVFDTTKMVPAVAGVARDARVAIAIHATGATVDADGNAELTGLGASVAVSVPATATTTGGVALYGVELTPQR